LTDAARAWRCSDVEGEDKIMRQHFLRFKHAATGEVTVSPLEQGLMLCLVAFALLMSANLLIGDFK